MHLFHKQQWWFRVLMAAAMLLGGLSFLTSMTDFLIVVLRGGAVNLPNLLFAAFRSMLVIVPLTLLLGSDRFMAKILRIKIVTGLWAVFAMFGFLWVLNYLSVESVYDLFDFDKIYEYQRSAGRYFIGNYIQWGSYRLSATVCSLIYCIILAVTSLTVHRHRKISAGCFAAAFAFLIITPFIIRAIAYHTGYTMAWLENNALAVLSSASMTAGVCVAAQNDTSWLALMWGENFTDFSENDED